MASDCIKFTFSYFRFIQMVLVKLIFVCSAVGLLENIVYSIYNEFNMRNGS